MPNVMENDRRPIPVYDRVSRTTWRYGATFYSINTEPTLRTIVTLKVLQYDPGFIHP
jgi:hypothetical protein